jgi:hypothetical protein
VRATYSRFIPDEGGADTNTYGLEAEWGSKSNEIRQFYLRVGVNRSDAIVGGQTKATVGGVGGAGVQWNYQLTQFLVDALRSFQPSSFGAVMTQNELRFRVNRALRPRFRGFIAVRGIALTGAQTGVNVQDRDYVTAEAGLEFQMTRNFRLVGDYTYTWQRFQGEPYAAGNAVTLTVVYQPPSRFAPPAPNPYTFQ